MEENIPPPSRPKERRIRFPRFPDLPREIRERIWGIAGRRRHFLTVVDVRAPGQVPQPGDQRARVPDPFQSVRNISQVNREARAQASRSNGRTRQTNVLPQQLPGVPYDPISDILLMEDGEALIAFCGSLEPNRQNYDTLEQRNRPIRSLALRSNWADLLDDGNFEDLFRLLGTFADLDAIYVEPPIDPSYVDYGIRELMQEVLGELPNDILDNRMPRIVLIGTRRMERVIAGSVGVGPGSRDYVEIPEYEDQTEEDKEIERERIRRQRVERLTAADERNRIAGIVVSEEERQAIEDARIALEQDQESRDAARAALRQQYQLYNQSREIALAEGAEARAREVLLQLSREVNIRYLRGEPFDAILTRLAVEAQEEYERHKAVRVDVQKRHTERIEAERLERERLEEERLEREAADAATLEAERRQAARRYVIGG